jgi:Domain of Unknown Function (DUF326)
MSAQIHALEQCIENCLRCHRMCLEVAARHFRGEATLEAAHLRLLLDCAEICETSASFMIRGSDLHPETCAACATICEACADECDRHGEDPHMAACAEICRRCAQSCREMAGASSPRR